MRRRNGWAVAMAAALVLGACGRRDAPPAAGDGGAAAPAAGQPAKPAAVPAVGVLPQGVSKEVGAEGRELYQKACVMCHGENGGGTALGPSLIDRAWLEGNGSFEEIVTVVRNGVATPKEFTVPMPARGDGHFTDEQIRAVSAYTSSIANAR